MEMLLSAYVNKSDRAIFWSSFLGFVGIALSSLCYFGIYRLMAVTGDFGQSIEIMIKFASYFLLPTFIVFVIFFVLFFVLFFVIFCTVQIVAFAKGYTPYPKWCLILCSSE